MRSKLVSISVKNVGCIGSETLTVKLDNILCLVGANNAGKTTILRAYELAHTPSSFDYAKDRCNWAPEGEASEIQLDVHIPEGMGNVDEKWKFDDGNGLRIVRSRWIWPADREGITRETWDPEVEDWASDGKAGGADNVFKSRLPKPMRVGSLDDAIKTEEVLLTLALSPIVTELKASAKDENSDLFKARLALADTVNKVAVPHEARINEISEKVMGSLQAVFPDLGVKLQVEMPPPDLKIETLLKQGSGIRIEEASGKSQLTQQGTGARRALFWSMLQVHNEMERDKERRTAVEKALISEEKKKTRDEAKIEQLAATLAALDGTGDFPADEEDPALPGYILLMDEPENALHPMAARLAQTHLYALANHPDWQVLITTHSPYFINPLEDHTTIARLERSVDGKSISPLIYVADQVSFSPDEKENLKALQLTDVSLAEVFFGSYPILVEGDTEQAAFLGSVQNEDSNLKRSASIIRARGKAILIPLMKILHHFKTDFGIVHDVDWPFSKSGESHNPMWTINNSIREAVIACRQDGINVRHRWSIPDFERFLGGEELGKDKPYEAYKAVTSDKAVGEMVLDRMIELYVEGSPDPDGYDSQKPHLDQLLEQLSEWAAQHGEDGNVRLTGSPQAQSAG